MEVHWLERFCLRQQLLSDVWWKKSNLCLLAFPAFVHPTFHCLTGQVCIQPFTGVNGPESSDLCFPLSSLTPELQVSVRMHSV